MSAGVRTRVRGQVNTGTLTLYVTDCATCGIVFGLPDEYDDRRRDDGRSFHCPNGHSLSYNDTAEKRLKRELEAAQRRANWNGQDAKEAYERAAAAERSAAAYRGHLTRIRRKVAAGVCPCCRRTFANVRRHIEGQHPAFAVKVEEAVTAP